jgi:hypothetical protein
LTICRSLLNRCHQEGDAFFEMHHHWG